MSTGPGKEAPFVHELSRSRTVFALPGSHTYRGGYTCTGFASNGGEVLTKACERNLRGDDSSKTPVTRPSLTTKAELVVFDEKCFAPIRRLIHAMIRARNARRRSTSPRISNRPKTSTHHPQVTCLVTRR